MGAARTSFEPGGALWRGISPEKEVAQHDVLAGLDVSGKRLAQDLTRSQTGYYDVLGAGKKQDIAQQELLFPSTLGRAQTADEREKALAALLAGGKIDVRTEGGYDFMRDIPTGGWSSLGPKAKQRRRGTGGAAQPSYDKLRDEFLRRIDKLKGAPVQRIRQNDGSERLVFVGSDAANIKVAAQLADIGQIVDQMQAADFIKKLSQGGEAFHVQPGLTIWEALRLSKGAVPGGRGRTAEDVGMGNRGGKPLVAAPKIEKPSRVINAGTLRQQGIKARETYDNAQQAIAGVEDAPLISQSMKARLIEGFNATASAAARDIQKINAALEKMSAPSVSFEAPAK